MAGRKPKSAKRVVSRVGKRGGNGNGEKTLKTRAMNYLGFKTDAQKEATKKLNEEARIKREDERK